MIMLNVSMFCKVVYIIILFLFLPPLLAFFFPQNILMNYEYRIYFRNVKIVKNSWFPDLTDSLKRIHKYLHILLFVEA